MSAEHPRILLFSDVDETFLEQGRVLPAAASALRDVADRVEVVFVSSRTVSELVALQTALGQAGDFLAEDGAITAVRSAKLARVLGPFEARLVGDEVVHLLRHAEPVAVVERAMGHIARRIGLEYDLSLAGFGRDRDHTILLPADHPDVDRLSAALVAAGFDVRRGHRWVSVARGGGKGEAIARYVEARRMTGSLPEVVAAIGDSDNDRSMLAVVLHRFVINRPGDGYHPALAAIPGIRTLEAPGHLGWIEAVECLCALSVEALP